MSDEYTPPENAIALEPIGPEAVQQQEQTQGEQTQEQKQ